MAALYSSPLVRVLGIIAVGLVLGSFIYPQRKWVIGVSAFALIFPAKAIQALVTRTPSVGYRWLVDAYEQLRVAFYFVVCILRKDVIFLAAFAICVYLAVTLAPAKCHRPLRVLLSLCTGLMFLVSGVELATYCKMGVAGTGHLLAFAVSNAESLWPMLRPELDAVSVGALCGPLLAGTLVALGVHKWYAQPRKGPVRPLAKLLPVGLALLIGAEFVHTSAVDHRLDRFVDNSYLALTDMLPWGRSGEFEITKAAMRLPALFDTSAAVLSSRNDAPPTRKNVIIIMLESTRANSTSAYDSTLDDTPFLASFAKRGATVQNMYAVIPRTSAAWVAVLDGTWPSTDEEMAPWARSKEDLRSLPMLLATQGYASAFFTTAHLSFGYDAPLLKNMQFNSVYDGDTLPNTGFEQPSFWGFEDRMMIRPSLDWVKRQRDGHSPFLLVLMTTVGHYDYKYPSSWLKRSFGNFDEAYNSYLNCLAYVDSVLKEFIDGLEKLGVLRSSVVIILGDHGESFGEHGQRAHGLELYDETLRIPAILYADGLIVPGTSIPGLRQQVDILPTVLDVLGFTLEKAILPGTSLLSPVSADRSLYFSGAVYSQATALRRGRLKFIYNFERTPMEAYAIDRDPGERHDLATSLPPSVIADAKTDMLLWRERVSRALIVRPKRPTSENPAKTKVNRHSFSRGESTCGAADLCTFSRDVLTTGLRSHQGPRPYN